MGDKLADHILQVILSLTLPGSKLDHILTRDGGMNRMLCWGRTLTCDRLSLTGAAPTLSKLHPVSNVSKLHPAPRSNTFKASFSFWICTLLSFICHSPSIIGALKTRMSWGRCYLVPSFTCTCIYTNNSIGLSETWQSWVYDINWRMYICREGAFNT